MEPYNSASGSEPRTSLHQIITNGGRQERIECEIGPRLLKAMRTKNAQQANELLKCGIDPNVRHSHYRTLLHAALIFNSGLEIVRGLLDHGADVQLMDEDGYTVLHVGITFHAAVECITELLNHGADPNVTSHLGMSPLHIALSANADLQVVRTLIHHGAQVNAINKHGFTPLRICIFLHVPIDYVKLLLQCGAHISITDRMEKIMLRAVLSSDTKLPLAKLFVKYTLIRTFVDDSCNHFSLDAYHHLRHYNAAASYFDECILELVKMKTTKVNNHTSLLAFVTTKNLNTPLYSENENSQSITHETELMANYPIYSDVILPNIAYALERGMLFMKLHEVFVYSRNYYGFPKNFGTKVVLNSDCLFIIAKNMSNVNLCNLMLAFYHSKSCIRISGLGRRLLESPTSISCKKARWE